jgi:hypothetical protein
LGSGTSAMPPGVSFTCSASCMSTTVYIGNANACFISDPAIVTAVNPDGSLQVRYPDENRPDPALPIGYAKARKGAETADKTELEIFADKLDSFFDAKFAGGSRKLKDKYNAKLQSLIAEDGAINVQGAEPEPEMVVLPDSPGRQKKKGSKQSASEGPSDLQGGTSTSTLFDSLCEEILAQTGMDPRDKNSSKPRVATLPTDCIVELVRAEHFECLLTTDQEVFRQSCSGKL